MKADHERGSQASTIAANPLARSADNLQGAEIGFRTDIYELHFLWHFFTRALRGSNVHIFY
jgi:hypothetical protein